MRRTSTLFTAIAVLLTVAANAQYTQDFETTNLTSGCSQVTNVNLTTDPADVITGLSSLNSNPPVNGNGTRDYYTPYLNITGTSFTVSFNYKLNTKLTGSATRSIEIGLQDKNGVYTTLATINMDKNFCPVVGTAYSGTFTVTPGVQRLVLKMGGSTGLGTSRTIIDDIVASANTYYSLLGTTCNTPPALGNDVYFSPAVAPYNGSSVLVNDSDPNGESLSVPVVQTASPDGTVVFNPDGSFTFTPNATFTGPSTSFTYIVYDNGFDPASSVATVTIYFASAAPLPVKLISFQGALISNKAQLKWAVADNEQGDKFYVEKSTDGKSYSSIALVFTTDKTGTESYVFNESSALNGGAYYRINMVGKDGSSKYTNILYLKNVEAGRNGGIVWVENPVKSSLTFSYDAQASGSATVNIYSMTGARIQTFQVMMQKGINTLAHPADSKLISGAYILEVNTATERRTVKITK